MTVLALEAALLNQDKYAEFKEAQLQLERARNDYELGYISRANYIEATEKCIRTIRACSPISKKQTISDTSSDSTDSSETDQGQDN